jgi:hypothetical protein
MTIICLIDTSIARGQAALAEVRAAVADSSGGAVVETQIWVTETDKQLVRSTVTSLQIGSVTETLEVCARAGMVGHEENPVSQVIDERRSTNCAELASSYAIDPAFKRFGGAR